MGFFKRLHNLVVKQRCLPWRVRAWLANRCPRLLVFLHTGRMNANTPQFWNRQWQRVGPQGAEHDFRPQMFGRILELVARGSDVLDVGCGAGILMQMLKEKNGCRVTGVDISPAAAQLVNAKGMPAVVAKLPNLPLPDHSFDFVIATELLEHLTDPAPTIQQMCRVTRPGGTVIATTPNTYMNTADILTHMRIFDADSLKPLLSDFLTGVTVEPIEEQTFEGSYLLAWGTVRKVSNRTSPS